MLHLRPRHVEGGRGRRPGLRPALVVTAAVLLVVPACSDDDGASAPTLGGIDAPADAGSVPAVPAASGDVPTVTDDIPVAPVGTDDLPQVPVVPVGTDDIPYVPLGTDDIPQVPQVPVGTGDVPVAGPPVSDDPLTVAVDSLTPADVCRLVPPEELEPIVGVELTAPIELDFDTLGAACSWVEDVGGTSATVASIEVSTIAFDLQLDPTAESVSDCVVGGLPARCQDEFTDAAYRIDATVVVALGGNDQPALVVTSSAGLAAATEIAELAVADLDSALAGLGVALERG